MAGSPLDEIRRYVDTTAEIDYPKYLGYAGLEMDTDYRIHFQQNQDKAPVQLFKQTDWKAFSQLRQGIERKNTD